MSRDKSSQRMRRRWREQPEEMRRVLDLANAQASKRNRTRWQTDRERMTAIVTENARKGSAALTGSTFTPERSRRASVYLRGRLMGGQATKGPEHFLAKGYSLLSPDGTQYQGENIIDFVRTHPELFAACDVVMEKGTCRAAKMLSRLRPWISAPRERWKGWRWYSPDSRNNGVAESTRTPVRPA